MDRVRSLISKDPDKATIDSGVARVAYFDCRNELLGEVSSLIDRGRFLFPNEDVRYGLDKGAANRGFRDPALDRVVSAYRVLQAVDYRDFGKNRETIHVHNLTTHRDRRELDERGRQLYEAFRHLSAVEQERLERSGLVRLDDMIVAAKRSFVNEVFEIVQATRLAKEGGGSPWDQTTVAHFVVNAFMGGIDLSPARRGIPREYRLAYRRSRDMQSGSARKARCGSRPPVRNGTCNLFLDNSLSTCTFSYISCHKLRRLHSDRP